MAINPNLNAMQKVMIKKQKLARKSEEKELKCVLKEAIIELEKVEKKIEQMHLDTETCRYLRDIESRMYSFKGVIDGASKQQLSTIRIKTLMYKLESKYKVVYKDNFVPLKNLAHAMENFSSYSDDMLEKGSISIEEDNLFRKLLEDAERYLSLAKMHCYLPNLLIDEARTQIDMISNKMSFLNRQNRD